MAALVLGAAGAALGPELFGTTAFSLFGVAVTGASIGGAIGTFAGSTIDNALLGGLHTIKRKGPRLTDLNIQTAAEGAPIPRAYGYMRLAGQLIWATRFKETVTATTSGGKGGTPSTSTTTYNYSISFAVGLCEGRVTQLGRVWADGMLLDASKFTTRFYHGTEDQTADPLIEEIEGAGNTPAYRGLCYIVFEDMPLAQFGNRIPQLQFELIHSIAARNPAALENVVLGVNLIPASGEFVYATEVVTADDGLGKTIAQNNNNSNGVADALVSLDALQALAPNLQAVTVVAGWFGNDLRTGNIAIKPGVETYNKVTYPQAWQVDGVNRADAHLISQIDGRPAYGGTPSDACVVQIISELKARGLRVNFNPFLFMDVAAGNTLPDPYSDNAAETGQPVYPWRGRITCSPAAGFVGTVDKTATAATQVANFFGAASVSDFSVSGATVHWTGGTDWGWRRMVLHYAHLCAAAGGVDAFLIGSELRGLSRVRSDATTYPAVAALKTLAADVKSIVGAGCKVGYAADWSEYNNHQTGDAAGAVLFNLDPLWSDANIDFVGVDNYLPLSDWRDGAAHLDYSVNGPTTIYDANYLAANIQGGEDYDWYYASASDRDNQIRTPITDTAYGKPWVWRQKDFWNWWSNYHYDRPDGTESGSHTSWVPQSKPIWFAELGAPALDKGANQPNVFFDPKSSESQLPYYSNGQRDDLIQRMFLEAHLNFWTDGANNPTSGVYSAPMVDASNIYLWCWDARPYPFFPERIDQWSDGKNYQHGHWLNGRLGTVLLPDLVAEICDYAHFNAYDVADLRGLITGFSVTSTMSPRDALEPLATAFHFDGVESEGLIHFLMRGRADAVALFETNLVIGEGEPNFGFALTRAQDNDLPVASRVTYIDPDNNYEQGVAEARRLVGNTNRVAESHFPLVMSQAQALGIGDQLIQEAWLMRETAAFALPPSRLALDPADEIAITAGGRARRMRVNGIDDNTRREVSAVMTDGSIYEPFSGPERTLRPIILPVQTGRALLVFADLPMLTGGEEPWAPHVATYASPWPGAVLLYRSPTTSNYVLDTTLGTPARIGTTLYDFYSGATSRWDEGNALYVQLINGTLASASDITVLGGANALAVENADGEWEVVQFASAELVGTNQWKLTHLLRGQLGTEGAMRAPVAASARVVALDASVLQTSIPQAQYALPFNYLWGPQDKDISDPAYQSAAKQFQGIGYRPYSPCHVAGTQSGSGDIALDWIRRTRIGGDSWEQTEVLLGEESEAYEMDIYDGADVVRTLSITTQQATYTASQQTTDFGGTTPFPLDVAVYQLSSIFGRGQGKRVNVYYK